LIWNWKSYTRSDRSEFHGSYASWTDAQKLELRELLTQSVERDPFVLARFNRFDAGPVLAGLAALQEHQRRAFTALESAHVKWPLQFSDGHEGSDFHHLNISLPADVRLLPLIASARISTMISMLSGGTPIERPEPFHATDNRQQVTPSALSESFRDARNTPEERAASLLLLGLDSQGGWTSISEAKSELMEFAKSGLPVAVAVALILELRGHWSEPSARQMVSELVAASRVAALSRHSLDKTRAIDAVLRVWRERSRAPLTGIGAMTKWLGLADS